MPGVQLGGLVQHPRRPTATTRSPVGVRAEPRRVRTSSGAPISDSMVRIRDDAACWVIPSGVGRRAQAPGPGDLDEQLQGTQLRHMGSQHRHKPTL